MGEKYPSTDSLPLGTRSALLRTGPWQGPAPASFGTGPSDLSLDQSCLLYGLCQASFIRVYRVVYDRASETTSNIAQQLEFTCLWGLSEFTGVCVLITACYSCTSGCLQTPERCLLEVKVLNLISAPLNIAAIFYTWEYTSANLLTPWDNRQYT